MPTKAAATLPVLQTEDSAAILADYLTRAQVLKALGRCLRTWLRLESLGDGPPRTVIGKTILYRREKFNEWLLSHEERGGVRLSANGRPRRVRKGITAGGRKPVSPAGRNVRRARRSA